MKQIESFLKSTDGPLSLSLFGASWLAGLARLGLLFYVFLVIHARGAGNATSPVRTQLSMTHVPICIWQQLSA